MKRITFFASMSVAAGGALVAVSPASAQETCYKITDLGALGFTPGSDNVFGINNDGEAVFTAVVGAKKHAMLYLPLPAYGFTERGRYDLHTLAGLDADAESAAYEINDAGIAVGWADIEVQPGTFERHALVWQINDYDRLCPPLPTIDLATFSVPDNGAPKIQVPTVAWAINDAVPPVVVGDATALSDCFCPPTAETYDTLIGFKAELGGNETLQELLPIFTPSCDYESHGRDISFLLAVGYSDTPQAGVCVAGEFFCERSKDAVHFPPLGPTKALADLSVSGSEARGVGNGGSIVGWGYNNTATPCGRKALFWEDKDDLDPTILPTEVGQETWAEAINNLADPQVVGWNETTNVALLWKCDAPGCDDPLNWSVTDLNDAIQHCSGTWSLVQAYDLTDAATPSIVGWGFRSGVKHGFVLTPLPNCCHSDLDGSGSVGAADLLALLASWGPCEGCPADFDDNGDVGASDLLALLANWGPCP